jgi:hypothetical protein
MSLLADSGLKGREWIHIGAAHFTPLVGGQPVCFAKESIDTPSGLNDQNMKASPFFGLYATEPFAHSDSVGSTCAATSAEAHLLASAGKQQQQ